MARHQHVFVDVNTEYFPPLPVAGTVKGWGEAVEKVLWGWTVVHQRCECGDIRNQEVIGRYDNGAVAK